MPINFQRFLKKRGTATPLPPASSAADMTPLAPSPDYDNAMRILTAKDLETRAQLFNRLYAASGVDLFYVRTGDERFIVNCKDNVISKSVFAHGEFEFSRFLQSLRLLGEQKILTGPIDMLVDIGANIGNISISAILRGYAKKAVAIEPHPFTCRILRANVCLNGLDDQITVHEAAASDRTGTLELELSGDNWGDHRIAVATDPGKFQEAERQKIAIPARPLDSMLSLDAHEQALLYLVTQGYEGLVLKGASALLRRTPPILAEFWPYAIGRAGGIGPLQEAVGHYRGFYNLGHPSHNITSFPLRPIADITSFFEQLGPDSITNYILIV